MEHLRHPVRRRPSTFADYTSRTKIAPTDSPEQETPVLPPSGPGVDLWSVETDPSDGVAVTARPRGLLAALLLAMAYLVGCDGRKVVEFCAEECERGGGEVAGWQNPNAGGRPVCLCAVRLDGGAP